MNPQGITPSTQAMTPWNCMDFVMAIFLFLIPSANPISFNISCFNQGILVPYHGGDYATDNTIQINGSRFGKNLTCQAVSREPVHLWDKATGKLTDFNTSFSFAIDSQVKFLPGDGLSFFLVPNGSNVLPGPNDGSLSSTKNQTVALEFGDLPNYRDPSMERVGINKKPIRGVRYVRYFISAATRANVSISYSASIELLCIFLIHDSYPDFSGNSTLCSVVDLRAYLSEWVSVEFSAAVRESESVHIHSIYSWQFYSSLKVVEAEKTGAGSLGGLPSPKIAGCKEKRKPNLAVKSALAACVLIGGACFLLGGWIFLRLRLRKKTDGGRQNDVVVDGNVVMDSSTDDELEEGTGPKRFSYSELENATNGFAEEGKLGQGGFGDVYRGFLSDLNLHVAVKRISKGSRQGRKEYKSEVKIISRLRHRNLVQLMGWCHERGEFLLVYEFMHNGSLDYHLFHGKSMLSWEVRYRIALGLGSALLYLHEEWEQCVVHRDIKSSNVMLDTNFNTKLGDFGLARLVDHAQGRYTTGLAGTFGYMAPEYISTGKTSKESDVFSFGVVALEIACGRRAVEPEIDERQVVLVPWVWELYGKESHVDAVDQRLCGDFDGKQIARLMIVGMWCAHPDHTLRPSIRQAMQVLNFEAGMPNLPMKMPVATYVYEPNSWIFTTNEPSMTFSSANVGR